MDDKEFYKPIENKRREIASLDISKKKKEELYILANNIVEENEISEEREQKTKRNYEQSAEAYEKMFNSINQVKHTNDTIPPTLKETINSINQINSTHSIILPKLERIAEKVKIKRMLNPNDRNYFTLN